jgi:CHAD domain-containing protein
MSYRFFTEDYRLDQTSIGRHIHLEKKRMTPQVDRHTPLWAAARVLLHERVEDFFRLGVKVLKTFDPEDIHDLRVASRRFREGLALFAPCYSPGDITFIVKKAKRVTRLLGDVRNTDEAIIFFTALADEIGDPSRGSLDQLVTQFQENRTKGLKRLEIGLREIVPKSLQKSFQGVVESPVLFKPSENGVDLLASLSYFARNSLDDRLSDLLKLVRNARRAENIEAQHLLRIAIKHYRYRMEILDVLIGPDYGKLHGTVKDYQEVLGKMHDLDVFAEIVREACLPSQAEKTVLDSIGARRKELFANFSTMLETMPLEKVGEQVRSAL